MAETIAYQFPSSLAVDAATFSWHLAIQNKYYISQPFLQLEVNMWLNSSQWAINGTGICNCWEVSLKDCLS